MFPGMEGLRLKAQAALNQTDQGRRLRSWQFALCQDILGGDEVIEQAHGLLDELLTRIASQEHWSWESDDARRKYLP